MTLCSASAIFFIAFAAHAFARELVASRSDDAVDGLVRRAALPSHLPTASADRTVLLKAPQCGAGSRSIPEHRGAVQDFQFRTTVPDWTVALPLLQNPDLEQPLVAQRSLQQSSVMKLRSVIARNLAQKIPAVSLVHS
eukprot:gnl/TRDRNA2_/TRDRNA2_156622_c0_seq2.p2 gnl/TRDRNA2_/TRDRNA2_156622_c0~~gnl/TRDRNA2_/TRDRNA2_156622_c0_seq2.p2  ORF type:complete len:138 (+),score=18.00 gnl/TRDRNA2_/TRDRNA2_156622_c0_seq2:83-496(+)